MTAVAQIYLVQRRAWEPNDFGYICAHAPGEGVPVGAFRDRERADEYRAELEYGERLKVDPFAYPDAASNDNPLDELAVARALHDIGVRQPTASLLEDGDWSMWWRATAGELTPRDAMAAWDALGGGHFTEVVSVELEDAA